MFRCPINPKDTTSNSLFSALIKIKLLLKCWINNSELIVCPSKCISLRAEVWKYHFGVRTFVVWALLLHILLAARRVLRCLLQIRFRVYDCPLTLLASSSCLYLIIFNRWLIQHSPYTIFISSFVSSFVIRIVFIIFPQIQIKAAPY